MLFNLQKTLAMLIMPLGLLWLCLFTMFLWSRKLRRPAFTAGLGLAWFLLAVAGSPWVGQRLMAHLEEQIPANPLEPGLVLDAVFVLGGGSELNLQGQPQFGIHGDRIAEAARLWHAGRAKVLVASGRSNNGPHGDRDLPQETRTLWVGLGVPASAIRSVTTPCLNTREEIAAYRAMCNQEPWPRVGLLTSASHLPRALRLARKAHLDVIPLASDAQGRRRPFRPQDLVPQSEGLRLTQMALWEMVGQAMGR